jgi:hypothetical protein
MIIKSLIIGGWFQRTTLHLTELQSFFLGKEIAGLESQKIKGNFESLKVLKTERIIDEMEYLKVTFANDFILKIFEDGLIILKNNKEINDKVNLEKEISKMKSFYEDELSKAISYVFSRGAPIPKELAKIENIFPFILHTENISESEMNEVFTASDDEISTHLSQDKIKIYKGKKIFFIINPDLDEDIFDILSETEIFFREFKVQMARYLHIHREIWEKINDIKNRDYIRGNEILKIREELQEEQKTINLIEARINQMPVYLKTRQKLSDFTKQGKDLHPLLQFKFETLLNTHDYIKSLWAMTKNYMNSANDMLAVLQTESTKSSISSLTLITTIGVVAGIVNYMARDTFPNITVIGFYYFLVLILITFLVNIFVMYLYKFKKYKIKK